MIADLHLLPALTATRQGSPAPLPIRVVLADDHALMRHSLRMALADAEGVELVAESGDMESTVRLVHLYKPHVLVLDLRLRGGSSVGTVDELRERVPDTRVVVLSMDDSPAFAQHALACGANGFVLKQHADSELAPAIRAAANGQRYVSPHVGSPLQGPLARAPGG